MKILVFGASGMLGNAMFRLLNETGEHTVIGTARSESARRFFPEQLQPSVDPTPSRHDDQDQQHPDHNVPVVGETAQGVLEKDQQHGPHGRPDQ
ncbi:MAG: NAD-dependent epimerase/dehydratase family protein, partial [Planctomycetia bacterium]|nr:NAD-dependent epimerase/dehydratase family protein [Planctomycetia bacterium]